MSGREALDHFTMKCKKILLAYFVLTWLCFIIDIALFFDSLSKFGNNDDPYSEVTLLVASLVFLLVDLFYFAWLNSLKSRLPTYLSSSIFQIAFGLLDLAYQ